MRHAEQNFSNARLFAGSSDVLKGSLDSPDWVNKLAAKKPIKLGTIAGIKADRYYQSKYGTEAQKWLDNNDAMDKVKQEANKISRLLQRYDFQMKELIDMNSKAKGNEKREIRIAIAALKEGINSSKTRLSWLEGEYDRLFKTYQSRPTEDDAWRIGKMGGDAYRDNEFINGRLY